MPSLLSSLLPGALMLLALLVALCGAQDPPAPACGARDLLVVVELPLVSVGAVHDHVAGALRSVLAGAAAQAGGPHVGVLLARCMNQGSARSGCPGRRYQGALWTPALLDGQALTEACLDNTQAVLGLATAPNRPLSPPAVCSTSRVRWERWDVALDQARALFAPLARASALVVLRSGLGVSLDALFPGLDMQQRSALVSLPAGRDRRFAGTGAANLAAYLDAVLPGARAAVGGSGRLVLLDASSSPPVLDPALGAPVPPPAAWTALPTLALPCLQRPFRLLAVGVFGRCQEPSAGQPLLVGVELGIEADGPVLFPSAVCSGLFGRDSSAMVLPPANSYCIEGGSFVADGDLEIPEGGSVVQVVPQGIVLQPGFNFGVVRLDDGVAVAAMATNAPPLGLFVRPLSIQDVCLSQP